MAIFPFDEEAKRRLLMTPGINGELPLKPAAGSSGNVPLPSAPSPRPLPALGTRLPRGDTPMAGPGPAPMDMSGVGVPIPSLSGNGSPTPYSPLAKDRYDYVSQGRGEDGKYHRSLGDIAKGALIGGLRGLGSGGGLAGAAGGALAGAGTSIISPRIGREAIFDSVIAPGILRNQAMAQQQQQLQRQQQEDLINDQYKQAQIGALNRSNQPEVQRLPTPDNKAVVGDDGRPLYVNLNDPANRGRAFRPYEKPEQTKPPTAAELATDPDDGSSVEEKARASYEARGGDQYVYDRLPERTRRILEDNTGKVSPAEVAAAQREFDSARNRQWQSDLSYTKGAIRSKVMGRRGGARRNPAPQGSTTRSRSEFNSSKFPGLKFD